MMAAEEWIGEAVGNVVAVSRCAVCNVLTSGRFFGALCCASCKDFFRRNYPKADALSCSRQGRCTIDELGRRDCAKCRFDKCLEVGMRASGTSTARRRLAALKGAATRKRKLQAPSGPLDCSCPCVCGARDAASLSPSPTPTLITLSAPSLGDVADEGRFGQLCGARDTFFALAVAAPPSEHAASTSALCASLVHSIALRLDLFARLPADDQMWLLDDAFDDLVALCCVVTVGYPDELQTAFTAHLQCLRATQPDLFARQIGFARLFNPVWRADVVLMFNLFAVVLFAPFRQLSAGVAAFTDEYNAFHQLLWELLAAVYSPLEVSYIYDRLMERLNELQSVRARQSVQTREEEPSAQPSPFATTVCQID